MYKRENNKNFDWHDYLQGVGLDEVTVDLSHCGIAYIPDQFIVQCSSLQYLYLEENAITDLNKSLFPNLRQLKWLDVRNNELTSVPNSILDHPSLQVLLLEGNKIQTLPLEIGSLPSLRGIQLARNPITYPPQNVINQGVQNIIDFMRKQWQQLKSPQHIQLISETHSQSKIPSSTFKSSTLKRHKLSGCKSAAMLKVNSHQPRKPRNVQSGLSAASLSKCISVRPISQSKQVTASNYWPVDDTQQVSNSIIDMKINSYKQEKNMLKVHPSVGQSKNAEDVQPKLLRDLWIEKIRQVLMTQETILQQRKNAEVLKQWQDEAKVLHQGRTGGAKQDTGADINFPYDTDPGYLKMLSREDIEGYGKEKRRDASLHTRHDEPINSKIFSIMVALQELKTSQSAASASPRSEQKVLAQEMKKIKDIQRSLNALKLKNFGQLDLSL